MKYVGSKVRYNNEIYTIIDYNNDIEVIQAKKDNGDDIITKCYEEVEFLEKG